MNHIVNVENFGESHEVFIFERYYIFFFAELYICSNFVFLFFFFLFFFYQKFH